MHKGVEARTPDSKGSKLRFATKVLSRLVDSNPPFPVPLILFPVPLRILEKLHVSFELLDLLVKLVLAQTDVPQFAH